MSAADGRTPEMWSGVRRPSPLVVRGDGRGKGQRRGRRGSRERRIEASAATPAVVAGRRGRRSSRLTEWPSDLRQLVRAVPTKRLLQLVADLTQRWRNRVTEGPLVARATDHHPGEGVLTGQSRKVIVERPVNVRTTRGVGDFKHDLPAGPGSPAVVLDDSRVPPRGEPNVWPDAIRRKVPKRSDTLGSPLALGHGHRMCASPDVGRRFLGSIRRAVSTYRIRSLSRSCISNDDDLPVSCNSSRAHLDPALDDRGRQVLMADKGYRSAAFEAELNARGMPTEGHREYHHPHPTRHQVGEDPAAAHQVLESVPSDHRVGQPDLQSPTRSERHGGRKPEGVCARVLQRILALTAAIWHNETSARPGPSPSLIAYDH